MAAREGLEPPTWWLTATRSTDWANGPYGWGNWIRTSEMTESKSVALPLGYTPINMVGRERFELPKPEVDDLQSPGFNHFPYLPNMCGQAPHTAYFMRFLNLLTEFHGIQASYSPQTCKLVALYFYSVFHIPLIKHIPVSSPQEPHPSGKYSS